MEKLYDVRVTECVEPGYYESYTYEQAIPLENAVDIAGELRSMGLGTSIVEHGKRDED